MQRLILQDAAWSEINQAKAFLAGMFGGPAPDRPGAIVHPDLRPGEPRPAPEGATPYQKLVWDTAEGIRRRPFGRDDFVPSLGTNAGTCAMATAFGCEETCTANVYWVKPCISHPSQIDHVRKPAVTAGKLGKVLEQTQAFAEFADPRLPIRIMDFQSPFTTVEQMLGSDQFFFMPYDEPERLKALMDVVTDFTIEFFQAQMTAAGPACCPGGWPPVWFPRSAGIQMADDNLVNVSPAVYEEFVVPYNNRISAAFGGLFLHSCTIKEAHLPVLKKLNGLTGINCDISTSVTVGRLLAEFGDHAVVAPHAYINTDTQFRSYEEMARAMVADWRPGKRLFLYPCVVLYDPRTSREMKCNEAELQKVLSEFPGWRRDHPAQ